MQRITHDQRWPLFDAARTRAMEAAAQAALPPHTLMQCAGRSVAQLALAIAPHARTVWLACGPGNNGGDGLEAAALLAGWGKQAVVTWLGDASTAPADARAAWRRAQAAGVHLAAEPPPQWQLAVDALFGIGTARPLQGAAAAWRDAMRSAAAPVLAVDLPSGLHPDTGRGDAVRATHTLALLTLKPGLFTGAGRDACGDVWFDDLGVAAAADPSAWHLGAPGAAARPHDSHKGRWGDVAVVGGAPGMAGAALLAASGALHGGAGRVFVGLLDAAAAAWDPQRPELMLRDWRTLELASLHVVAGCGGAEAVRTALPAVLADARSLVLDADALNAVAADAALAQQLRERAGHHRPTVLTPHPLEAARLLGCDTATVQADRVAAAQRLAQVFGCVVVLKGSGTVVAAPGRAPGINPTGNAGLATAGTGDVLAGLLGARLAAGAPAWDAACDAVWTHGQAADAWPAGQRLTAAALAERVR